MPPDRVGPSARSWSGRTNSASARLLIFIAENRPRLCDPVHTGSYFQLRGCRVSKEPPSDRGHPRALLERCAAGGLKVSWDQAPARLRRRAFQRCRAAGIEDSKRCESCVPCMAKPPALLISTSGMSLPARLMTSASPAERDKFIIILIRFQCPHRYQSECRMDILAHDVTYTFALAISTVGGGTTGGPAGMTSQPSSA
jgi:hypothetical protein